MTMGGRTGRNDDPRDRDAQTPPPEPSLDVLRDVRAQLERGARRRETSGEIHRGAVKAPLTVYPEPALETASGATLIKHERNAAAIAATHDLSIITARLLAARGFRNGRVLDDFLSPQLKPHLARLETLTGLSAAIDILIDGVRTGKPITLVCDYDADGTTSAAILWRFLRGVGAAVKVLSPDRGTEGHGLNTRLIDATARRGVGILVALDFGTKSHAELARARDHGLQTIVIDHHHKPEGPPLPTDALINPRQDGCGFHAEDVCTAGLAWLVASALRDRLRRDPDHRLAARAARASTQALLPLAALGTIADVVELTPCNRALVAAGLTELDRTSNKGLRALKEVAGITAGATATDLGFGLGPRLNALSRMLHEPLDGKTPGMVMTELLTTPSTRRATELAELADQKNVARKELEKLVFKQITEQIEARGALGDVIFVADHEFAGWIQGILASRLVERYNRPAFVMRRDPAGLLVGSARGVPGVHLAEILEQTRELIERGGGHPAAAGFSLRPENLPAFEAAVTQLVRRSLGGREPGRRETADIAVSVKEIRAAGPVLIEEFARLEPCGRGNPAPSLFIDRLAVAAIERYDNRHLKVWFRQGDDYIYGFLWNHRVHPALTVGATVDVVARPFLDTRGATHNREKQSIKLELRAIRGTV
jgi:single-stranded-DNA-specific exonuclease